MFTRVDRECSDRQSARCINILSPSWLSLTSLVDRTVTRGVSLFIYIWNTWKGPPAWIFLSHPLTGSRHNNRRDTQRLPQRHATTPTYITLQVQAKNNHNVSTSLAWKKYRVFALNTRNQSKWKTVIAACVFFFSKRKQLVILHRQQQQWMGNDFSFSFFFFFLF